MGTYPFSFSGGFVLGLLGFLGSSGSGSVVRFVSFRFVHISIFSFVGIPLVDVLALFRFRTSRSSSSKPSPSDHS